jgi:hypothetical protein
VVQRSRGREGARELRHRDRDDQRSRRDERPAEPESGGSSEPERVAERGGHAREHADDGKTDGETREAAEASEELLRVAETCKFPSVVAIARIRALFVPRAHTVVCVSIHAEFGGS